MQFLPKLDPYVVLIAFWAVALVLLVVLRFNFVRQRVVRLVMAVISALIFTWLLASASSLLVNGGGEYFDKLTAIVMIFLWPFTLAAAVWFAGEDLIEIFVRAGHVDRGKKPPWANKGKHAQGSPAQ